MLYSRTLLGLALAALGAGAGVAADQAPAGAVEKDYVFDISGAPARTGLTGDCVYTRVYTAEGVRPRCLNETAAQQPAPAAAKAAEDQAAAARAAEEAAARAAAQDAAAKAAAEAAAAQQTRDLTPATPGPPAETAKLQEPPSAPARPAIKTVALDTQTLFGFDRSVITPAGRQQLDAFVAELADFEYGTIRVTGHADRIGSDDYNVKLSRDRAEAVKRYLTEHGIDARKIEARGVGASEPITRAGACDGLKRASLIDCLHPDRRVEVEAVAQREE
jgi:OOP family OmpA-OmpF porin